ncbi:MAG: hypothetical protein IKN05_06020 [Clostridia bacterium]|nr:hypothetical protein [Clostridia bacterium]
MAALLKKSAKGGKPGKGVHGRLPTKRSINLVLVDEKKINIPMTVLSIVLIVGLAYLFGKYLVADRIIAVSEAAAKVERLQADLDATMELLNGFGDVETTYAHYTMEGMNQAELDLVDRVQVLDLVTSILPEQPEAGEAEEEGEDDEWFDDEDDEWFDDEDDELEDGGESEDDGEPRYVIRSWSVSENVLTVEIGGPSLESLNLLAKSLEDNPIVNSCAITTANKDGQRQAAGEVLAKLIVYLQKPVEEVKAP